MFVASVTVMQMVSIIKQAVDFEGLGLLSLKPDAMLAYCDGVYRVIKLSLSANNAKDANV
jgi:hypothetical protein